jgi:O-acetyl-ADP-ribose deacetylase (regulator of RNase III)
MDHIQKRKYLINQLLNEANLNYEITDDNAYQKALLRGLFNIRDPKCASPSFLQVQDEYLKECLEEKGIVDAGNFDYKDNIAVYKGDITTLKIDAIVNAANKEMLGCFYPNHNCIDNAIHTYAGINLRYECQKIMNNKTAAVGDAIITSAYNLPSKYVIHTVGPCIITSPTKRDKELLSLCYINCLKKALEYNISSIAFCCISTGVYNFPAKEAASIAVKAVKDFIKENKMDIRIVFNVFKEKDYEIYRALLG